MVCLITDLEFRALDDGHGMEFMVDSSERGAWEGFMSCIALGFGNYRR